MSHNNYQRRFHEALSKAFAAKASNVRSAYFDLASLYHRKLDGRVGTFPSNADLRHCLAVQACKSSTTS